MNDATVKHCNKNNSKFEVNAKPKSFIETAPKLWLNKSQVLYDKKCHPSHAFKLNDQTTEPNF